jgi:excinuclease ABC subunit B
MSITPINSKLPDSRDSSIPFKVGDKREPKGDQPTAIKELTRGFKNGLNRMTLLGVTGSGKTFTVAHLIEKLQLPTLIIAHNKTLAAQLYSEFASFFPENAVRYFVSYYDYYQPEAYVPSTDTFIEKDASINEEIDKLRHASTKALLERKDTIVVSSVSCIYGLGDPDSYFKMMLYLESGDKVKRLELLRKLVLLQYQRQDNDFTTGTFRVRGDVVEVCTADETDKVIRIELFGDEVESLSEVDRLTGKILRNLKKICIYPASHFVTEVDAIKRAKVSITHELEERLIVLRRLGKNLEADRLELMSEMGFCSGIENYSRHITGRPPGAPPPTLLDYFPDDFLVVIDESHVTTSQISGMYRGDQSRKQTLVDFGFRLPSALDNRPLQFDEFYKKAKKLLFVSATPNEFEIKESNNNVVEQVIRPTGLLDPIINIRPATNQVDDLLEEIRSTVEKGERILVTTLTKRMAEDLSEYYREVGVKVKYLHSEIHTLDRIDIIRGLRTGEFDVLIGINLLREGLDLPEVSLVAILDADKEGFLRSETSLIQTMGRAARNINGKVILYADKETGSMQRAISETNRRRKIQEEYNIKHDINPTSTSRSSDNAMIEVSIDLDNVLVNMEDFQNLPRDPAQCKKLINSLRAEMFQHAKKYEFEQATLIRDKVYKLEKLLTYL